MGMCKCVDSPLQCDRGVIVSGRAGGIPSFFDSAIGGTGPHPMASMGSGFTKIKANEPVLVDLVHLHRGYVVDMTRMFVAGSLSSEWQERLEDMIAVKEEVVDVLDQGKDCSVLAPRICLSRGIRPCQTI